MKHFLSILLLAVLALTACRTTETVPAPEPKPLTGEWLYYPRNDGGVVHLKCDQWAALVTYSSDPNHKIGDAVMQFNTQPQNASWGYAQYTHQFSWYTGIGYADVYPCNYLIEGAKCTIHAVDHNGMPIIFYLYKL